MPNLKKLTKILAIAFLLAFSFNILIAVPAQAQLDSVFKTGTVDDTLDDATKDVYDPAKKNLDLPILIGNIISYVLGFLGVVLLILIIYGGFLWMTAGGEDDRVAKAKKIIANATVGVVIVVCAYILTYYIIDKLVPLITTA